MARALPGITVSITSIQDSNALLLYKVGPVLVCSPAMPVESVTIPPHLTTLPGTNAAEPGMFKSIHGMVRTIDLRVRFGVDEADRKTPGRIIIAEVTGGYAGFWVDEIEDVISFPESGWSSLPVHVPREVFSRALIRDEGIRLYADLENLDKFKSTGYLRAHIEHLKSVEEKTFTREKLPVKEQTEQASTEDQKTKTDNSASAEVTAMEGKAAVSSYSQERESQTEAKISANEKQVVSRHSAIKSNLAGAKSKKTESVQSLERGVVTRKKTPPAYSKIKTPVERQPAQKTYTDSRVTNSDVNKYSSSNESENINVKEDKAFFWIAASLAGVLAVSSSAWFMSSNTDFLVEDKKGEKISFADQDEVLEQEVDISTAKESEAEVEISETEEGLVIVINDYELPGSDDGILGENSESPAQVEDVYIGSEKEITVEEEILGDSFVSSEGGDTALIKESDAEVVVAEEEGFHQATNVVVDEGTSKKYSHQSEIDTEEVVDLTSSAEFIENKDDEIVTDDVTMESKPELGDELEPELKPVIKTLKHVHIVVKGDTLWHIARRYVNNPWKYPELARLSKIKNPDLIYPGQKVIVILNYTR